jgi:hypothetical protein
MQHYVITMDKLALLDWFLNPEPTIAFSRYNNRIYVNIDWTNRVFVGDYIIFEVYKALSETDAPRIFQDRWLQRYTTALFKQQWGANLKKFGGIQLVGGVTLNGQSLFDEATMEIERLEQELYNSYQPPARIFIG